MEVLTTDDLTQQIKDLVDNLNAARTAMETDTLGGEIRPEARAEFDQYVASVQPQLERGLKILLDRYYSPENIMHVNNRGGTRKNKKKNRKSRRKFIQ